MKNVVRGFAIVALVMLTLPTIAFSASDNSGKAFIEEVEANLAGEMTLQEWFDANGYTVNVTEDELGLEIFSAGYYQISIDIFRGDVSDFLRRQQHRGYNVLQRC
jgi:hypothetical protein